MIISWIDKNSENLTPNQVLQQLPELKALFTTQEELANWSSFWSILKRNKNKSPKFKKKAMSRTNSNQPTPAKAAPTAATGTPFRKLSPTTFRQYALHQIMNNEQAAEASRQEAENTRQEAENARQEAHRSIQQCLSFVTNTP